MKKTLHISFAILYLLLIIGVQISTHYCGNYAVKVDLYASDATSEPSECCDDQNESSCCTTNIQKFQILELHQSVTQYKQSSIQVSDIFQSASSTELISQEAYSQHYNQSTQLPPSNNTNILNCTFRI